MKVTRLASALAAAAFGLVSFAAFADVAAPQDVPYQGTLKMHVDATDVAHRMFSVREDIPVGAGPLRAAVSAVAARATTARAARST